MKIDLPRECQNPQPLKEKKLKKGGVERENCH